MPGKNLKRKKIKIKVEIEGYIFDDKDIKLNNTVKARLKTELFYAFLDMPEYISYLNGLDINQNDISIFKNMVFKIKSIK